MSSFLVEPPAVVILTVDVLLIFLSLAVLFRLSREANAYSSACSILQSLAQAIGFARRDDAQEADLVRRRVMEEMQTLQQKRMKLACVAFLLMLTLGLLISAFVVSEDYGGWSTLRLTYMLWFSVIVFSLIASCWQFCSSWHAQATYGLMMLTILLFIQLMNAKQRGTIYVASFWFAGLRLALCSTCMDVKVATFWNVTCVLCNCWKFMRMVTDREIFKNDSRVFIACECFFCLIAVLGSACMREWMLATLHHHFSTKAHEVEHSASHLLLEHVCDAVLPTDADMKINGSADRFAAMLMLDSSRCKKGTDFQEFMPVEEDQERFRTLFASPCASSKPESNVPCMNVHLRNGIGNNLRVEVIGVKFKDINDEINYMFGVRESLEGQSFPIRDLGDRELVRVRRPPRRLGTPPAIAAASINDHGSSSTLSNASHGVPRLAAASFAQTSLNGQILSLAQLMMTWNLDTSWRKCCTFHSFVPQLRRLLDDLAVAPCKQGFHKNVRVQCKACGVLDSLDADNMCLCCNSEAALLSL
eukprot:TRINITY_DN7879_c0_g1_i3.p1 TRINITY_DN7879_c0_g1~~TRINITY_DN7879_c0_g1_i3.p1  ORF type:complete len:545 (-),score=57.75 TRINITY_DN7879_c0_g1_i3:312-1904(-)